MGEKIINFPSGNYRAGSDQGGGHMEARVAKLEAHVEHIDTTLTDIKNDIREMRKTINANLLYVLGAIAALAGLMAKGFNWF